MESTLGAVSCDPPSREGAASGPKGRRGNASSEANSSRGPSRPTAAEAPLASVETSERHGGARAEAVRGKLGGCAITWRDRSARRKRRVGPLGRGRIGSFVDAETRWSKSPEANQARGKPRAGARMGSRVRRLCSWFGSFAEVGERCGIGRRRANSSTTTDVAGEAEVAPAKAHRDQANSGDAVAGLDSFGNQRRWKASWAEVGNAVDAASVESVLTHESCGRRRLASCSCGDIGCQRLVGSLRYAVE